MQAFQKEINVEIAGKNIKQARGSMDQCVRNNKPQTRHVQEMPSHTKQFIDKTHQALNQYVCVSLGLIIG